MSVEADFVADCTTSIDALVEKWFGAPQRPKSQVALLTPSAVFTYPKEMNFLVLSLLLAFTVAVTVLLAVVFQKVV